MIPLLQYYNHVIYCLGITKKLFAAYDFIILFTLQKKKSKLD